MGRQSIQVSKGKCAAVLAAVALSSCSDVTGPSAHELEPIGGGLSFSIVETFRWHDENTGEPALALHVETINFYGCVNYSLDSELGINGNELTLSVAGVQEPNICLTATGPAVSYHPLPRLDRDYTLTFSFGKFTDTYRASITASSIEINPNKAQFTQRQHKLLWRYPPRSFALVCDAEEWGEQPCTELSERLAEDVELSRITFSTAGTIPYPTDRNEAGRDWRATYFQLERGEDFDLARSVFCSYVSDHYDLAAYLLSWKNERLRSWVPEHCSE